MTCSAGPDRSTGCPREVMRPERPGPNLKPFVPGSSRCAPQAMLGRSECDAASMKAEDQQEA